LFAGEHHRDAARREAHYPGRATHLNQLIRQLCLSQPSQIQEYQLQQVFSG
jgi:hypothetical protein